MNGFVTHVAYGLTALACASVVAAVDVVRTHSAPSFDPTAYARDHARVENPDAQIPPACWADARNGRNPCYVCHARGAEGNLQDDRALQLTRTFAGDARRNPYANLLVARADRVKWTEGALLDLVREDNYRPLAVSLRAMKFEGFIPDLDLEAGFDDRGFARDGSRWRTIRYRPFPGLGYPTNGSIGDVFIRLPPSFSTGEDGKFSLAIYAANFEVLEARLAGLDLPARFFGAAAAVPALKNVFPVGTEFLHTVRYLDPDDARFFGRRMKEVRYMRKTRVLDAYALGNAHREDAEERSEGHSPQYRGDPRVGLENDFGWRLQGFIEDETGRLRLQTQEEHQFCMGCHANLGITVDQTFSFARKLSGAAGYALQSLRGMPDAPMLGHDKGEVREYVERSETGDDFGANPELASRVREHMHGGEIRDLATVLLPSRERAMEMNRAYRVTVREQSFMRGRDATLLAPPRILARTETDEATGARPYGDARLRLAF